MRSTSKKIYSALNKGYTFVDYLDHKHNMRTTIRKSYRKWFNKRLRIFLKQNLKQEGD